MTEKMASRNVCHISQCSECIYKHFCEGGCSIDSYIQHGDWKSHHPWCEYYKGVYAKLLDVIAEDEFFVEKAADIDSFNRAFI